VFVYGGVGWDEMSDYLYCSESAGGREER
jgi:hypothetical protein